MPNVAGPSRRSFLAGLTAATFVLPDVSLAAETVMVGPMCAAPESKGFDVRFDDWTVQSS
jgi:regulation of enolase protein 1 (concanavalin A-like superfamily)